MSQKYFTVFYSILAALLVASGVTVVAQTDATGYSVYADSVESGPGSDVTVRFYAANEEPLASIGIPVVYDPSLVTLKSISFAESRAQHIANKIVTPADLTTADGHFLVAIFQWLEDPIPAGEGLMFSAVFGIDPNAAVGSECLLDTLFYPPGGLLEVVPSGSTTGIVPEYRVGQIRVGEPNRTPVFSTVADQYVLEGDSLILTVVASDPDDDPLALAATTKPSGASFTDNGDGTARFAWVPDYVGPNSADGSPAPVSFWASDGDLSAQMDLTVNVLNRNRKPIITAPDEIGVGAGDLLELTLTAMDPDFEEIHWTWFGLPSGATFDGGNPGHLTWESSVTDSGSFDMGFVAIDPQGLADTAIIKTSIEAATLYTLGLDSVEAFPGEEIELGIFLENELDVGGFNVLFNHDPIALTYLSLSNEGTRSEGFEYFVVQPNEYAIAGNVRLIGIADNGGGTAALGPGEGPIAKVRFRVTGDLAFAGLSIPLVFRFNDMPVNNDNTLTDDTGGKIEQTEITYENGSVLIHDAGQIRIGDINLNGLAAEIGDVIYFTNFFINPTLYQFNALQYANSDVNGDNIAATLSDLVALINIVVNGSPINKLATVETATASIWTEKVGHELVFGYDAEREIGAAFLILETESPAVEDEIRNLAGAMTMDYRRDGRELKVLLYDLDGGAMPSGRTELFAISAPGAFEITRMELGGADGRMVDVSLAAGDALPTGYVLSQNYPNPFNPQTTIEFALPQDSRVELAVYNVLGQRVVTLAEGDFPAGSHRVSWDGTDGDGRAVASGVYLYRLWTGAETMTRKMMLLK